MQTQREYALRIPEAKRRASLIGVEVDLQLVTHLCGHLEENRGLYGHWFLWEALATAIVVRYARCFAHGVRDFLKEQVLEDADRELRDMHAYLIDLRNKHIAHSVNPFEENCVTAQVGAHFTSSSEISSLGAMHARSSGLELDDPAKIKLLCEWLLGKVRRSMEDEAPKILLAVHRMSLKDIESFGSSYSPIPDKSVVAKTRSRP